MRQDVIESVKIAPPGYMVTTHYVFGVSWSELVSILMAIYVLLLIIGWFRARCREKQVRINHRRRRDDK